MPQQFVEHTWWVDPLFRHSLAQIWSQSFFLTSWGLPHRRRWECRTRWWWDGNKQEQIVCRQSWSSYSVWEQNWFMNFFLSLCLSLFSLSLSLFPPAPHPDLLISNLFMWEKSDVKMVRSLLFLMRSWWESYSEKYLVTWGSGDFSVSELIPSWFLRTLVFVGADLDFADAFPGGGNRE